jgi:hypothetical protein
VCLCVCACGHTFLLTNPPFFLRQNNEHFSICWEVCVCQCVCVSWGAPQLPSCVIRRSGCKHRVSECHLLFLKETNRCAVSRAVEVALKSDKRQLLSDGRVWKGQSCLSQSQYVFIYQSGSLLSFISQIFESSCGYIFQDTLYLRIIFFSILLLCSM